MNTAAIVTMFLGLLIVATRGPLLVAPCQTIRRIHVLTATRSRIRGLGLVLAAIGGLVVWGGFSDNGNLAAFLLVVGTFLLLVAVPWLLFFPQTYKELVDAFVPEKLDSNLLGWRLLGLVGVLIGGLIFYVGWQH